ncbi:MAG: hypothetical protein NT140_04090 [Deltaproteobacteria bacterium]|nr:hypothetical protein [Deltaproteobacteria bacterium]
MNIVHTIEYIKKNAAGLKTVFFIGLVLLVVLDIFIPRENSHYFVDKIYAFWTFFALVGCFLLIKVSKGIAHLFLAKDEDYYG